ncbi:MAG TPA: hypothetical protein VFG56_00975 [Candidatus Saccharimonadales bacterium]|nr:hypothetical protein [Candidatus Saccharimonadales bacterium]
MSKNTQAIIILVVALLIMAALGVLAWRVLISDPDSVQKLVEDNVR